ncbi:MAG TPA: arsenate reductase ArsC [Burkholderiaceae bacterium]
MSGKIFNVLFLCTGNSARSVMSEALVTILGNGRFRGYSAGSHPTGTVNPFAIEQISRFAPDFPIEALRSKSWDEFAAPEAPEMDFIVTVCDNAAGEACPYWPGRPATAHWSYQDPAAVEGSVTDKRMAFAKTFGQIRKRMEAFVALPIERMSDEAIRQEARKIGEVAV